MPFALVVGHMLAAAPRAADAMSLSRRGLFAGDGVREVGRLISWITARQMA